MTYNTFSTAAEYNTAKEKLSAYDAVANKWRADNKTNGMPMDIVATMPYASEVNNEMRSKIEVWEFLNNPPDKYFLYIDEKENKAITWMGDILGSVTFGTAYKCNFGDTRQHITISAINGKTYHGTYFKSSGNYARIKAAKRQTK